MVSVVIPCLNEVDYIDETLHSLIDQVDFSEDLEVLVVDGGSTDGTRERILKWSQRDSRFRMLDNPMRYTPQALNIGIRQAKGEWVIILGAHATCNRDFLRRNWDALRAHPESACVGGVVEQQHGSHTSRRIGAALSTPFGVGDARFRTGGTAGHVDTVAFGAYRKSALIEIGLFDEHLVRNQDDELNFRLHEAGWRIWFDPRIRSSYHVRSTYGKLFRQYRQYGYWKVFVNRKHRTVTTWRQVVPALFLLSLFAGVLGCLWEAFGYGTEAWKGLSFSLLVTLLVAWMTGASFSAVNVARDGRDVPGIIWAFAVVHFAYGWGYWEGVFRFILLQRAPRAAALKLTR
jgi:cellulose synthase/poly-beta-1,6-N-acetylglucosamine synthase-like glycosyltransferase